MSRPLRVATSPWVGIKWIALGLLALLIGFTWSLVAERRFRLWLYAGHYVAAELEVTRFIGKPRNSQARCWIEGVIHPGGERVVTSDRDIAIKRFIGPDDRTRNEPLPGEIEGQRLAVSHWPRRAEVKRWWHPPTVVSRGEIRGGGVIVRDVLLGGAFVGVGLFCFRRGFRYLKAAVPPEPREKTQEDSRQDSAPPTGGRSDPTRHWAKTDEPLPPFDLAAGALGGLTLGDGLEQAEFLGRPDRVEHLEHSGGMRLHYFGRGFRLGFMPQFVELTCHIAPPSDVPPERGQGFSRPRLSGGIELTPETSVARVRDLFGPPKSEYDSPRDKTLTYSYLRGRFYMEFEFEQSTGRLLTWSVPL